MLLRELFGSLQASRLLLRVLPVLPDVVAAYVDLLSGRPLRPSAGPGLVVRVRPLVRCPF